MNPTIFVSSEQVSHDNIALLIKRLREDGFHVIHSPLNPLDGEDARWENWYNWENLDASGLETEIGQADLFIVGVTSGWDGSTWMMMELEAAGRRLESGQLKALLYYSPGMAPREIPMAKRYLTDRLPDDLNEALKVIKNRFAAVNLRRF
ncbi:MAG: hypothetical protein JWQ02_4179 [Capsulimonas sp.]|nr:hypothetical protein [Capsulimonas sp.]